MSQLRPDTLNLRDEKLEDRYQKGFFDKGLVVLVLFFLIWLAGTFTSLPYKIGLFIYQVIVPLVMAGVIWSVCFYQSVYCHKE